MLDAFTPEEFDERLASEAVDGTPADWVERLAVILKLGFASICWSKVDPADFDPLDPNKRKRLEEMERSNPYARKTRPAMPANTAAGEAASPDQAAALFASCAGPANGKKR